MVSTVKPKYLTLVSIHKPLGIVILVLVLVRLVRLRYGAFAAGPPAQADEACGQAVALRVLRPHDRLPLLGWGMLSAASYPVVLFGGARLPAILPQKDGLHTLLWNAHFYLLSCSLWPNLCNSRRRSSMRSSEVTAYSTWR
jgi:cytochrome b561